MDNCYEASFLEEETRCGYTIKPEMKKVWAVELNLLQKLLQVCDKYNLQCFAEAGTLLGAVRHKGFIPWDDDIDIAMFRKDYDRLAEISNREFREPYFFQTVYSDNKYPRGHAQLRNSNTTAILKSEMQRGIEFNQGIFIDIFVLDGVADNWILRKLQKGKINIIKKMINTLCSPLKTLSKKGELAYEILKLCNADYRDIFKKEENCLRKYSVSQCEYVAPLSFIFETEKRIRNKHLYDETIWLPFEFMSIPAPAGYDEFLTRRYGDYMKPAQVPTTHGEVLFDTDKPYTEYLKREYGGK